MTLRLAATVLVCATALASCAGDGAGDDAASGGKAAEDLVAEGEALYQETCAACHGADLEGTDTGPPFLDVIYAPNHHPDESFYAAVENGVQPHHWEFGPMPPQPSIDRAEVEAIVEYVRQQQADAGITEDPSH
jgi:mono/diheme cytochrome c family protein